MSTIKLFSFSPAISFLVVINKSIRWLVFFSLVIYFQKWIFHWVVYFSEWRVPFVVKFAIFEIVSFKKLPYVEVVPVQNRKYSGKNRPPFATGTNRRQILAIWVCPSIAHYNGFHSVFINEFLNLFFEIAWIKLNFNVESEK